jgi:putative endonuclease
MKSYYVYIMANKSKMTYIGITSNLSRRVQEHKNKSIGGYTSKYNLTKLVYYEIMTDVYQALKREKQLKNWHRQWKVNLIEQVNKHWEDLAEEL